MIRYELPASSGVLQRYDFNLLQAGFNAAGTFNIPISAATFVMLVYKVNQFNNTWNTNDPRIDLITDNVSSNLIPLTWSGGNNFSDPIFTLYPSSALDATVLGTLVLNWSGNAGLITGAEFMNLSLFYVVRAF